MAEPVTYIKNFLGYPDDFYLQMLDIDWERRADAPRSEHWSSDYNLPYTYGKRQGMRTYEAKAMPDTVRIIRDVIKITTGVYHQGCFCNRYNGERDWLGWHADDDPGINHQDPISVVTLGQARAIQYQAFDPETLKRIGEPKEVMLEHGSLLIMHAGMQQTHYHRIPKAGFVAGTRISLTYRSLLAQSGV
jgi:alkylated DNA repair dioxygenase AlkB